MFHPALFKGANVVVTGAGRGIGLEVARQFLDCGAHVLLHGGREPDAAVPDFLEEALEEARAHIVHADFLTPQGVSEVARYADNLFEQVDVLVNNAGTMVSRF
ncbi:MAG TPA: SDR family oxidoreductase, partial [Mycoplana sp.]|nr:SDR family oxidoreductase [Mycoplana sp.]